LPEATACHTKALEINRRTGRTAGQAVLLGNFGVIDRQAGRLRSAVRHQTEALALHSSIGSRDSAAMTLTNLAEAERELNELVKAEAHFTEALELQREVGNLYSQASTLSGLASVRHAAARGLRRRGGTSVGPVGLPGRRALLIEGGGRKGDSASIRTKHRGYPTISHYEWTVCAVVLR
jgi:hypothetical protein